MSILSLDYGEKRIGIAVSPDGTWAFERPVLLVSTTERALSQIADIVERENVHTILLGLPLTLSGNEGPQACAVRAFFAQLIARLPNIPCTLVDERFTTSEAQRHSRERGDRHVHHADSLAAKLLLEGYLTSSHS